MRVIRGVAALGALIGALFGVPVLLLVLSRQLWPALSTWSDPLALLTGPDPLVIMITLLLGVAWLAWLIFTVAVLGELIGLMSGRRIRLRLPGLPASQRFAAGLFVSVIAMVSTTQLSSAELPPRKPQPEPTGPPSSEARRDDPAAPNTARSGRPDLEHPVTAESASPGTTKRNDVHVHVVELGDDLWSLAQRYYGRGTDWRRIAAANPSRLSGGPDRLDVGWKLRIPGVETDSDRERMRGRSSDRTDDREDGDRTVVVKRGDTLSAIAQRAYGAERRWPVLWRANRFQLDDPDELLIGMRLVVPGLQKRETKAEAKDRAGTGPTSHGDDSNRASVPRTRSKAPAPAPRRGPGEPPSVGAEPSRTLTPDRPEDAGQGADSSTVSDDTTQPVVAGLVTAGALLSASLIAGLAARRRLQLQARPLGRRILHPPVASRTAEVVLGRRASPLGLRTLDLATRAIGAHCHHGRSPLPCLTIATVSDDHLELQWTEPAPLPPPGFRADGSRWLLDGGDVGYLKTVPGLGEAARPFPALVTLGLDDAGRPVVGDLETLGLLRLQAEDPALVEAALAAMAVELSFSPWADEMILTLVGRGDRSCPSARQAQRHQHRRPRRAARPARAACGGPARAAVVRDARRAPDRSRSGRSLGAGDRADQPALADAQDDRLQRPARRRAPGDHGRGRAGPPGRGPRVESDPRSAPGQSLSQPDAALEPAGHRSLTPQRSRPRPPRRCSELWTGHRERGDHPGALVVAEPRSGGPPPDNVTYLGRRRTSSGTASWDTERGSSGQASELSGTTATTAPSPAPHPAAARPDRPDRRGRASARHGPPSSAWSTAPGCWSTPAPPPRRWPRRWPSPRAPAGPT